MKNKEIEKTTKVESKKEKLFKWERIGFITSLAMIIGGFVMLNYSIDIWPSWLSGSIVLGVGLIIGYFSYNLWQKKKIVFYTIKKYNQVEKQKQLNIQKDSTKKIKNKYGLFKWRIFKMEYIGFIIAMSISITGIVLLSYSYSLESLQNVLPNAIALITIGVILFLMLYDLWKKRKLILYSIAKYEFIKEKLATDPNGDLFLTKREKKKLDKDFSEE